MSPNRATLSVALSGVLVGCVFGVGLASVAVSGWTVALGVVVVLAATFIVMSRAEMMDRALVACLVLLGVGFGMWRLGVAVPGEDSVAWRVGAERAVSGTVRSRDVGESSQHLTLDRLAIDGIGAADRVLLSMPLSPRVMPGDAVEVWCDLKAPQPFSGFAYDRYLAARSVYATCRSFSEPKITPQKALTIRDHLGRGREAVVDVIERVFGEPHAALLSGLLLGTSRFSDDWTARFSATGTSHIVAASGYNVGVVSSLLLSALIGVGLWRKHAFGIVIIGLVAYALLAGAEPPVVRAAVMGGLVLWSRNLGRRSSIRNVFLLAVVGMLVVEPRLLRSDVGFQLSTLSTIGLIALANPMARRLQFVPATFGIREALSSTLAATVATLPVVALSFGQISLLAPLTNLLVLPFVPFVMIAGAAASLVGFASSSIAAVVALPAWLGLSTMLAIIESFANIPFAVVPFAASWWGVAVLSVAVVMFARWFLRRPVVSAASAMPMWATSLGAAVLVVSLVIVRQVDASSGSKLQVWVFDVGQGDAIFVDGPERDVLIDGGPSNVVVEKLSHVVAPWDRSIDRVVLTHPHADHFTGLIEVMRRYEVGEVVTSGQAAEWSAGDRFAGASTTEAGDVYDLGSGATLTTIWPTEAEANNPSDPNAGSVVMLLTYGDTTMLLTGDAGLSEEKRWKLGHVDVLKVGHHGSDTSTSQALLDAITPSAAIISVGEGNDYGHPSPFVVDRLERAGIVVYRTDQDGDVLIVSDGGEPTLRR